MSSKGYIQSLLNSLPADQKKVLDLAFQEAIDHFRLGANTKATNADWFLVASTTASVANTEFSFEHGMDAPPSKLMPFLDLTSSGTQLVPLATTRPADTRRVYLKSSSTSAYFTAFLE